MKRAIIAVVLLVTMIVVLGSCGGGGSSSNNTNQTSKLKTRAVVSNTFINILHILDYSKDAQTPFSISAGSTPQTIVLSDDHSLCMVWDAASNTVSFTNNTTEQSAGSITMPDFSESMAFSADAKSAFIAVRNAPVTGQVSGAVFVVDLTAATATATINVPLVRRIVRNPAGTFLLALSSDPVPGGSAQGQIAIVDIANKTVTKTITDVDRPLQAIFSTDGTKAYIINCGAECGGTAASVSVLDMSAGQIVAGSTLPLPAATTALLDGNNLYVAGNVAGVGGVLTPVTVSGNTLTKGNTVAIGDGFHTVMGKGTQNKVFIGANPCTNTGTAGCLSIYDTSSGNVVVQGAKGFVTGMDAVPRRDVMYVVEGGELHIYDTTTSAELAGRLVDFFGEVYDVKIVDK